MRNNNHLAIFVLTTMLLPSHAFADTEVVDGIEWTYTVRSGKASVGGGSPSNPAIPTSTSGAITIPSALGGCFVKYIGRSAFYGCSGLTSVVIGNDVTSIENYAFYGCSGLLSVMIGNGVTSIGTSAFEGCSGLTSITIGSGIQSLDNLPLNVENIHVSSSWRYCDIDGVLFNKNKDTLLKFPRKRVGSYTIPNSVTSIGDAAFYGCSGLTSITILDSVTNIGYRAFGGCSGLTSVTIPNGVTSIGGGAFSGCSGLTSVTIPDSVTSIGVEAFCNCSGLTSITIPDGVTSIGDYAFDGCSELTSIVIGNGVTSIGREAFFDCSALTSITIPDGVTSIGDYAFDGCRGLTGLISIPESVAHIGLQAFDGCLGISAIVADPKWARYFSSTTNFTFAVLDGVTNIGGRAFYDCSGLVSVTIPDSVTSIGDYAFSGCSGLTEVHISDLTAWCSVSFGYIANPCERAHRLFLNNEEITDLVIPEDVTSIGNYAFSGCSALTSITIPDGVTSIGDSAFDGCSGLTSITIPDSVTNIGHRAFGGCSGLTSIIIGNGVTSIGDYAFYDCSGLTSITIPDSVTNIGNSAFSGCSELTSITIPEWLADQTDSWGLPSGCQVVVSDNPCVDVDGVSIPKTWISGNAADALAAADGNYWTAARAKAANGRPVWECYVADLDPEDPDDDLVAGIEMVDGEPEVTIERGESANRAYTVQGAKTLGGGWTDLEDGVDWDAAGYRFFRVKVEMP